MNALDKALDTGFCLLVFKERMQPGWRALVAPDAAYAEWVEGILGQTVGEEPEDLRAYFESAGAFFPTSRGSPRTPTLAIESLTRVVDGIFDKAWGEWYERVQAAYTALLRAENTSLGNAHYIGVAQSHDQLVIID